MMFHKKNILTLMMGMILLSFPSCTGILGDIYDEPSEYGFIEDLGNHGTLYINTSAYEQWTYIDFRHKQIEVRDIRMEGQEEEGKRYGEPAEWDIAIHKSDCKTNQGAILMTQYLEIPELVNSGKIPEGTFKADIPACEPEELDQPDAPGKIIVDMSQMMDGIIKYAPSPLNLEISSWLEKDTSTMPPIITLSGKVYLVQLENSRYLALKLVNYASGCLTIQYHYPVEF